MRIYFRLDEIRLCILSVFMLTLACGTGDRDSKKLDDIVTRLDRIEKKLETPIRQFPMPAPEPDTKTIYSVPIQGDPFIGPAAAKVTVVEASDFA